MTQSSQPQPPPVPTSRLTREDLRGIATQQRVILICFLVYVVALILRFAVPQQLVPILGLAVLATGVVAAVFVFMLAIRLYGTAVGVVLGILTLIPVVGLIVLLIVNGKATSTLKSNNIQVGLMGADPKSI